MLIISIILLLIILFLSILLLQKKKIENEKEKNELKTLLDEIDKNKGQLSEIKQNIANEINIAQNLRDTLAEKAQVEKERFLVQIAQEEENARVELAEINNEIRLKQNFYDSLVEPLQNLEKEKQKKLFYTIHLTDEDKSDIMYLLSEVAPNIKHKDIVSKLIWNEFLKIPLDNTLNRIGVESNPGIYKITNIDTGKCYVGKSTNVKRRLQDHFKSVVGIQSISDQLIHREILKQGINNWMIEQICHCSKEELSDMEKYYIKFFDSINYGYNLKTGG